MLSTISVTQESRLIAMLQMIKFCEGKRERTVVNRAPAASAAPHHPMMSQVGSTTTQPTLSTGMSTSNLHNIASSPAPSPHMNQEGESYHDRPHVHIAAIDNSLSFPHQHPKGWRNFTYGWLYLVRSRAPCPRRCKQS